MYPKPFYQSKTFWLGVAQFATNAGEIIMLFTSNTQAVDPRTLVILFGIQNFLFGIAHIIVRFYTAQPISPVV